MNSLYQTTSTTPRETIDHLARPKNDGHDRLADSVELLLDRFEASKDFDAMERVDRVLDLGRGVGNLGDLSREELAEAFAILADLFERGIVGYEVREVNGEPRKVFIDVAIGSDLHRAPLYKNGRLDGYV